MFRASEIIIILASLLFLAIQLLFSFSYETFIPWDLDFGIRIYLAFIFFLWLATENYFYRIKEKGSNHNLNVTFPIVLVFVSFVVTLIVFEPRIASPSDGLALLFYLAFQSLVFLIYGIIRVAFFHSSYPNDDSIFIKIAKFTDVFLNKLSNVIIPILVILIAVIVTIAFNDYLSGGIKYKFSEKPNNAPMLELALEKNDISFCNKIKAQGYKYSEELQNKCIYSFIFEKPNVKNYDKESSKLDFFITYNKLKKQCSKTNYYKECTGILLKSIEPILESNTQKSLKTSWSFVDAYTEVGFSENGFGNNKAATYLIIKIIHKLGGYPADDFEFDYPVPGYDYPMYQYEVETISDTLNAFKKAQVKLRSDLKGIDSVVGISDSRPERKTIVKDPNGSRNIVPGKLAVFDSSTAEKIRLFSIIYIDIEKVANTKSDYEKIVTVISKVFSKQKKPLFPKNIDTVFCERNSKAKRRKLEAYVRREPICIDGKLVPDIKPKNRYID